MLAIEARAYGWPWSRGNFIDTLAAGHMAEVLEDRDAGLLGYFVAMTGVDELHLLNVTVAPGWQGRGHGSALLDAVAGPWPRPRPGRRCGSRCAGATTARAPCTPAAALPKSACGAAITRPRGVAKTPW